MYLCNIQVKAGRFNLPNPTVGHLCHDFKMTVILELRMWNGDKENDINKADNHNYYHVLKKM